MPDLVLLRHGQSLFNQEGRFTGWTDVDLSPQGIEEALHAGIMLQRDGYTFDLSYTSVLKRAIRTLWIVLDQMDLMWIPVNKSWRLNERNYGALQGQHKSEMEEKYGPAQIHRWRRGFEDRPPAIPLDDCRDPAHDPRYKDLRAEKLPLAESLRDTRERLLPLWQQEISPQLKRGKRILISSHGNTLRALIMHLEKMSAEEIEHVELPTGRPLVYRLDTTLEPISHFYLP
jgi:2,3-bisphosphoglycerate-dependent phosphoglycerate mutase